MIIPLRIDENNHGSLTMDEIAEQSGISRVYFQDLKAGRKNPKLEMLYSIAKAMKVPPGALLPLDWQKPAEGELNENLIRDVMKGVMRIYVERHEIAGLDLNWYYDMVIAAYKKYSKDVTENKPVNDNIVYSWIDGRMGA